jgi:hypothetical protein
MWTALLPESHVAVKGYRARDKRGYPDDEITDHGDLMQRFIERWELGALKDSPCMPTLVGGAAGDAYPIQEDVNDRWVYIKGARMHTPRARLAATR